MCRKARAKARAATIKTVLCLSRSIVTACKCAVVAHAALSIATLGAMTISQHPATSNWARLSHVDYNNLKYLNTHAIFPWVVVGVVSIILSFLDSIVIGTLSYPKRYIQTLCRKKTQKHRIGENSPPHAPPRQPHSCEQRPKRKNKHRLYPSISNFKVVGSFDT